MKKLNSVQNRKGVDPIIASILLIAVVLVLVGIYVVFGRGFAQERTQEIREVTTAQVSCAYAGISISDCNFHAVSNRIDFELQNIGTVDLTDFTLRVSDGTDLVVGTYEKTLKPGAFVDFKTTSTDFDVEEGAIDNLDNANKVRVTPVSCPSNFFDTSKCVTNQD